MTLIYLVVAWVAGILLTRALVIPWQVLLLSGLAGFIGGVGWRDSPRLRLAAACAVALALGGGRLLLALPHFDPHALATYNDIGRVTVEGVVVGEPDVREDRVNLRLRAERLILPDGGQVDVRGLALVRTARYPTFAYGDRLRVSGWLETPPVWEDFSYQDYLARQGVYSLLRAAQVERLGSGAGNPLYGLLLAVKQRAQAVIAAILHEPAAALLTGILLGTESGIPADLQADFVTTSTSHIVAISGFNITIISGIFAGLARRLVGPRRAVWVAIAGVVTYTVLVGAAAAVVRAAIMGSIYLLGRHLGREGFVPTSLAAAAWLMSALNPLVLWDVGFQFSFAATLGLVLYADPLTRATQRLLERITTPELAKQVTGWLGDALLVTMAAQVTTLPLTVAYFHRLSLVTLLTNLMILPAQPGVMIWGGLATLTGLVWLPAGRAVGWVAWLFLTYTIETVRLTARVPYASLGLGRVEGWQVGAFYLLLAVLTAWGYLPGEHRAQWRTRLRAGWRALTARLSDQVLLSVAAFTLLLSLITWRTLPDGRLHVTYLDANRADAVFVRTPAGRQVLIGGGESPSALLSELGRRIPFWDHSLDLVVLPFADEGHLAALVPILERYRVGGVITSGEDCATALCARWAEVLTASGATVWRGQAGLRLWLDEGLLLTVLHPGPDLPADPLVVRLDYGRVCFLFPGDADAAVEARLVSEEAWLDCTFLRVAHHGDNRATSRSFLEAVTPEVAVIPVAADDGFGHPHPDLLARLDGLRLYRSDRDGTVEVVSDGRRYWAHAQR